MEVPPNSPETPEFTEASPIVIRRAKLGVWIAWGFIALAVGLLFAGVGSPKEDTKGPQRVGLQTEILAKYLTGLSGMQGAGVSAVQMSELVQTLEKADHSALGKFRAAMLKSYLNAQPTDPAFLESLVKEDATLRGEVERLRAIQSQKISPEDKAAFLEQHGWFARLALTFGQAPNSPESVAIKAEATKTMWIAMASELLMLLAFVVGLVLLIIYFFNRRSPTFRPMYLGAERGQGGIMIEGMAIYFTCFLTIPILFALRQSRGNGETALMIGTMVLALAGVVIGYLWPRFRGLPKAAWKHQSGWHLGRGFWREVGWGILSWFAYLPILAVLLFFTFFLTRFVDQPVSHPLETWVQGGSAMKWYAVIMAVLWAPITEEMMFRGIFLPGLSAKAPWWLAALLSAILFAVIHPQSWVAMPALIFFALLMAKLRRWRGSLVAPMVVHGINNGLILLLMLLIMS